MTVRALFAERADGKSDASTRVLVVARRTGVVVEDVVTTGGSTRETIDVATSAGAQVVGATALIDRSGGTAQLGVPLEALACLSLPTYEPSTCPLCAKVVPVTKPGSRPGFVNHQ